MPSFCLPGATQDIINAQRTAEVYTYSGTWNPSIDTTEAKKGTVFYGVGDDPLVGGQIWQKQDNGCTTNWRQIAQGSASSSLLYRYVRYVDPVVGNDTTGDGSINKPYLTIAGALADITDGSSTNRYLLILAAGAYPEAQVVWKPWVSAQGAGKDATRITNGIAYTAIAAEFSRSDFIGLQIAGATDVDLSAAIGGGVNIRFLDCTIVALTYDGGPDYPVSQTSNLFLDGTGVIALVIVDGAAHAYDNHGIFGSLDIQDGPAVNSVPFLEICGGILQGTIDLAGKAQLISRGVINSAAITGVVASATTPIWNTDEGSETSGVEAGAIDKRIIGESFLDSAASAGGAATEALAVVGLAATDIIMSVTQRVAGANNTALTSFGAPGAGTLTVGWTADPGAGAIVRVVVKRK